jgi:hypothetical protein
MLEFNTGNGMLSFRKLEERLKSCLLRELSVNCPFKQLWFRAQHMDGELVVPFTWHT